MDIALITLSTHNIKSYAKYTKILNENYCTKHNYTFINYNNSLDIARPPAWSKILAVQNNLNDFDWVLWIDADAFILNSDKKLEELIDCQYNLIISKDWNGINTGVFLLKGKCNWSFNLLNLIYAKENRIHHPWWEQQALIDVLEENVDFNNQVKILPQKYLNGYDYTIYEDQDKNPYILHYPGLSNKVKYKRIKYYFKSITGKNICWFFDISKLRLTLQRL